MKNKYLSLPTKFKNSISGKILGSTIWPLFVGFNKKCVKILVFIFPLQILPNSNDLTIIIKHKEKTFYLKFCNTSVK